MRWGVGQKGFQLNLLHFIFFLKNGLGNKKRENKKRK
jgi:hypothetical protein